jgi:hypothetical protein
MERLLADQDLLTALHWASLLAEAVKTCRPGQDVSQMERYDLLEVAAEALVAQGAPAPLDPCFYDYLPRIPGYAEAETWADLVPLTPAARALFIEELKRSAERGGAAAALVARLDDGEFRGRVVAKAWQLWPRYGWTFIPGLTWLLRVLAQG